MSTCLDLAQIEELRALMGDDFEALLVAFLGDCAARFADLERALSDGSHEAASRAAHSLKGMCLNLGAARLADLLDNLEAELRNGSSACSALADAVRLEFPQLREAVEALRRT